MNEELAYTGTDNLEVMKEAVNYNQYLVDLVTRHAARTDRILDFGAGVGTFAIALASEGYSVECVEPDAQQAAHIATAGLSVYRSVAELPDDGMDMVYTLNVLEHIEDDSAVLCDLGRKIRPGGKLLVYVPAFRVLYSSMDRKVGHVRRYTRQELRTKVTLAGLKVVRDEYVDSIGFLASLLYRLLDKDTGNVNRRALRLYDRFVFPVSRIADRIVGKFVGKNVLLLASKVPK